ncbi:MAG TPA: phosphosulfolactate synthase [Gemmatimonadaceae bacterium]|nr:phosphosulfolactate synthase [Gemmatimonadaceae bacterium]
MTATIPSAPLAAAAAHTTARATFDFLRRNERPDKPRTRGITEIRGPYYTPLGKRALEDILETMGTYVDTLKFAGGSFTLMPPDALAELIALCHEHEVRVSTGGFMERVLTQGEGAVSRYIDTCADVGFDIIELSSGFITIPADDWLRLIERVQRAGLAAKPEVGIQFGAGGATASGELEVEGQHDVAWTIQLARRFLEAGAYQIMIESEGITENVRSWRTDVPARLIDALGLEPIMFEAADPAVFQWYIKHYGPEVNLFVDHSQIVELECLRQGIWGTASLWGRVVTYK